MHEFLYISHLFHFFILLSYLIFDFVCLTLSSAETHGIAKYARTNIQGYTHTHTQKQKTQQHQKQKQKCKDIQQTTVTHFGENKRLHLEISKHNCYIISL